VDAAPLGTLPRLPRLGAVPALPRLEAHRRIFTTPAGTSRQKLSINCAETAQPMRSLFAHTGLVPVQDAF